MTANVYDIHTAQRRSAPRLALAPAPVRRPLSATIALFGLGLTPGFLLAAGASAQGGARMVDTALLLAGISATVTVAAALRSRRIAVRRRQRLTQRARMDAAVASPRQMRRAA